jgi:hypothetical protein
MNDKDIQDPITHLVQVAELEIAKYLNRPEDFMVIEWLEGVQMTLTECLELLSANPIPLNEEEEDE